MKKYFIFAASALALASCSSDDYLGDNPGGQTKSDIINFDGATSKTTRDPSTGVAAANKLNNHFLVYGWKNTSDKVYDHYNVVWNNKAGQTESNTAGWEYVGQEKNYLNQSAGEQSIKYWDYSANQYDFVAFSLANKTQVTDNATDGQIEASHVTGAPNPTYTLKGTAGNLTDCYITDRVTAKKDAADGEKKANKLVAYGKPVQFSFRSLGTKVRMGLYETVPGYSIKDVKFYQDVTTKNGDKPILYAATEAIPAKDAKGTMTVTFGSNDVAKTDYNQAKVEWSLDEGQKNSTFMTFGALALATAESSEAAGTEYLGRTVGKASMASYETVLPNTVGPLTLKVDYTLVSIDGSGETIKVTGASAVVPAEYTNWLPNYAYTYIFKISDKTNGTTGTGEDPKGLYPITFDAIVADAEDGNQNTITTVNSPAITTYALGKNINNEYTNGQNIYVSASGVDFKADNCALYTAEKTKGTSPITEAYVSLCLNNRTGDGPWTLDDETNTLTVKKATESMSIETQIAAADRPDGNAVSGNFAKFTPSAAGTYVFEYTTTAKNSEGADVTVRYYKVIVVE